jgi:CRP-like cAMP-binding protein
LKHGVVLSEPDSEVDYVYFPDDALISILSLNSDGSTLEIGLVGNEGMVGVHTILGGAAPYRSVVQKSGGALRMRRRDIHAEFRRNSILQDALLKYTNAFLIQIAQSGVCNSYHTLQERLGRWLLVACECSQSRILPVTHEWLARVLGVRRASITVAAGRLRDSGVIRIRRGEITIIDLVGLRRISCECYLILQHSTRRKGDRCAYGSVQTSVGRGS